MEGYRRTKQVMYIIMLGTMISAVMMIMYGVYTLEMGLESDKVALEVKGEGAGSETQLQLSKAEKELKRYKIDEYREKSKLDKQSYIMELDRAGLVVIAEEKRVEGYIGDKSAKEITEGAYEREKEHKKWIAEVEEELDLITETEKKEKQNKIEKEYNKRKMLKSEEGKVMVLLMLVGQIMSIIIVVVIKIKSERGIRNGRKRV